MGTHTAAVCPRARRTRESVFEGQVRRRRAEVVGAARAPPRATVAVGLRPCLPEAGGSKSPWARVARNCPKEDTTVASHRRVAEAPLQAVLAAHLPEAMAVQMRQTKASRGGHRLAQLTQARKQWSRTRKLAGKCTRCPSFCSLYIFHRESGCNHCNGSRRVQGQQTTTHAEPPDVATGIAGYSLCACGNNDTLSKSSGAALPVAEARLDRVRIQEGKRHREVQREVGIRHSCRARVEDVAGRIRHASSSRVAQRRSVADLAAPGQEANYTYCQAEQDSRLGHQWEKQSRSRAIWDLEAGGSGLRHKPGERHGLAEESLSLEEEEASGGRAALSGRLLHQEAVDTRTLGFLEGDGPCRRPDLTS